jgi:amino acid adenylation domain-containing protein
MPEVVGDNALSLEEKRAALKKLLLEQPGAPGERRAFPLSFAQRRLWFLHRLYPDTAAYTVPWLKRLRGPLDRSALERALTAIVRRHESLRTTFQETADGTVQVVHPARELRVEVISISGSTPSEREQHLVERCAACFNQRFDLEKGPLFKATLFEVGPEDQVLLLMMHHIVTDGWSLGILTSELQVHYNAFRSGQTPPLLPLPIQYADFALWQKQHLEGEALDAQRRYWRERLAGLTPLALRTDHPRPRTVTFEGDVAYVEMPPALYARVKQISNQENVTLFVLLLAAFNALLHRYTGQDDIAVGSPIANRNRHETEGLIGFFVNTLVMRTDLSGNPSFRELVRRTRQTAFEAYDHQDVPFESIVEDLAPERDPSRHPLFQVAFVVQNAPAPPFVLDGLRTEDLPGAVARSVRMDLEVHLAEGEGERFACVASFNRDLFDSPTIERLLERYLILLDAATADPDAKVAALPMLLPGEADTLLRWSRGPSTAFPLDRCVHEYAADHARTRPEAPAIVHGHRVWTYGQWNTSAERLARRLRGLGVHTGDLVGVCLRRSPEMFLAQLAVLKAGGAYVALDPDLPPLRLADMIADVQAKVLLSTADTKDTLTGVSIPIVAVEPGERDAASGGGESDLPKARLDQTAYVIFTSGSTGHPKATRISHGGLINMCCWLTRRFSIKPDDRVSSVFAPGFDGLAFEAWPCFMAGAALYLPDEDTRVSADRLREWLIANEIAVSTVPTVLADALLALPWPETVALRHLIAGGDRLHRRPTASTPFTLINAYGPTENTVVATVYEVPPEDGCDAPPIGRPIDNVQAYILDEALRPAPPGINGELYLGGAQVAQGYINRPELTAETFLDNPFDPGKMYRTGDLARFGPDGIIEFVGRRDTQIQLYGLRIELGEIEETLCRHPAVSQAVALLREDQPGQKRLAAYVTGTEPLDTGALTAFLRERLPGYMVPSALMVLDALPLTPNGKIDQAALPQPVIIRRSQAMTPPRNAVEERLAVLWRTLLDLPEVGIEESFFDLGGNSLLILQAVTEIRTAFDVDPPLQHLFEQPSIAAWARIIDELQRGVFAQAVQTPIIPLRRHGSQTPLFCVAAVGGTVLTYYALTHLLGEDQPVYGLQDPAHVTGKDPIATVEELADLYTHTLREVQPHGPYRLFGWSFGAIVACEIARRLVARGETVEALFLLDPPPMSFLEGKRIERAGHGGLVIMFVRGLVMFFMHGLEGINLLRDGYYVQFVTYWHQRRQNRAPRAWWTKPYDALLYVLYKLFLRNSQLTAFLEDGSRFILIQQPYTAGFLRIFRANIRAMAAYRPVPCPVKGIVIFSDDERMAEEQRETERLWQRMCAEGLTVEKTAGNHLSTVRLPHVHTLAGILRKHMPPARA